MQAVSKFQDRAVNQFRWRTLSPEVPPVGIKTVLLHAAAEACQVHCGPTHYAVQLARAFNAQLRTLILELDVVIPRSVYGRQISAEARAAVADRNTDALHTAQRLQELAQQAGISADVLTKRSYAYTIPQIAMEHARLHDVTVTGVDERGLLSEHAVAEYVLFQSGRPLIVVPDDHAAPFSCEKVVVAWDFSRTAARALADALPLLRAASEVTIVTFGDDKEIDSNVTGDEVIAAMDRRGVQGHFQQVKRGAQPIGQAINSFADDRAADLLVMGGYGHSRFREFIFGGATREILRAPALPTFLSH